MYTELLLLLITYIYIFLASSNDINLFVITASTSVTSIAQNIVKIQPWESLDPTYWDISPSEMPLCPSKLLLINPFLSVEITIYWPENHFPASDARFMNQSLFWSNRSTGFAKSLTLFAIQFDLLGQAHTVFSHILCKTENRVLDEQDIYL